MNSQNLKLAAGLIAAAAIGIAVFFWQSDRGRAPTPAAAPAAPGGPLVAQGQTVVKYDPAAPLARRLADATDRYALYQDLVAKDDGESLFWAGQLVMECSQVRMQGLQATLDGFQANLKPTDPQREARIEAFRRLILPCAGFDPARTDAKSVRAREELTAQAATRGYLPAIVEARMQAAARAQPAAAAQDDTWVVEALSSGDPLVMNLAAAQIGAGPGGYMIGGRPLDKADGEVAWFAWRLVVCERGFPCEQTPALTLCAHGGICGTPNYAESVRKLLGPERYAKAENYKQQIAMALVHRDYASLGLVR